ncbi:MAG TPA: LEA type 2 family protein [Burkholderiales bacterium]
MASRRTTEPLILLLALVLAGCASAPGTPAPPLVHLSDLRVKDVRLFEQRYTLVLRLENPNPAELPVRGMAYRVLLNDVEVGGGTSRTELVIPPYGEALVEVDMTSNLFSLLDRMRRFGRRSNEGFELAIRGTVSVVGAPRPLPFSVHAQLGGATE